MKRLYALVILALALAGCGTAAAQPHARPVPAVTKTVVKVVTRTVKVPVPGPTVTLTTGSAQLAQDTTCIDALYQNIQGWKASGIVPNGWWDSRCPVPASSPAAAPSIVPNAGAQQVGIPGTYDNPIPGLPIPSINGATHSLAINCQLDQCTSLPGAGPNGSTCGAVVNNEQECVW